MNDTDKYARMNNAFESGCIYNASESELQAYLGLLYSNFKADTQAQGAFILRGLSINHIQMARLIKKLNTQNTWLTWIVIILAVASIVLSLIRA